MDKVYIIRRVEKQYAVISPSGRVLGVYTTMRRAKAAARRMRGKRKPDNT